MWWVGILIASLCVILVLHMYHVFSDLWAGFYTLRAKRERVWKGNYIKLKDGEQGYIVKVGWRTTQIKGLSDEIIGIPNGKLAQSIVANYHQPVKKAKEPFKFYTRLPLREVTEFKAGNLRELVQCLREVPDSAVYHHTHQFVQEYQYLDHQPPNEFAQWVKEALKDEILGKKLASIDTCEPDSVDGLRHQIIEAIEEHLKGCDELRQASEGRELRFVKSVTFVSPTPYVAHDLRELVEILHKISTDSLYFHIFEAKLDINKEFNDLSTWIKDSLGERKLAVEIARLDPYSYTLEELREAIIQLVESRLQGKNYG